MYIVVEGEDPGFDIFVNGHALARNEDALEKLAMRLGGDPEWARTLPPPQWFSPEDGLTTVKALLNSLRDAPGTLGSETQQVTTELADYVRVLEKTAQYNLRWQLAVSWK